MRGGIGGYPEIRRENEAGIKEVAARPDLNVMKRGREASITPGAWRRSSGGRKRGAAEKLKSMAGKIAKSRPGRDGPPASERAGGGGVPWRCGGGVRAGSGGGRPVSF